MSDVIDFSAEHDKRHGPDPEHVYLDPMTGKKWFKFMLDYKDGDKDFGLHIWATDLGDAERRLGLIRETGRIEGQLYGTIPA